MELQETVERRQRSGVHVSGVPGERKLRMGHKKFEEIMENFLNLVKDLSHGVQ